jgi:glutathione S-transferase
MALTLYALEGCPWCEKVHDALSEHGLEYETEWVPALHSEREAVKRISNQRFVPVLVDDERGVTMNESANIIEYIERTLAPAVEA